MRFFTVASIIVCCLALSSCMPPDEKEVAQQLKKINADMAKEMVEGVFDSTLSRYVDECVSMPNNGPVLKGKQEIRAYYQQMMASGVKVTQADFKMLDVKVDRTYAVEIGEYTMTLEMPGMPAMPDTGKYMTVWSTRPDGDWKIKIEMWNSSRRPSAQ